MFSSALVLDTNQVMAQEDVLRRWAPRRHSELESATEVLRIMTEVVESKWEEVLPEVQAAFRAVARMLEHPPRLRLWERLRFAYLAFRAGPETFAEFNGAVIKFRDSLTAVIARENRQFEKLMQDSELQASIEGGWEAEGDLIPLREALSQLEQG